MEGKPTWILLVRHGAHVGGVLTGQGIKDVTAVASQLTRTIEEHRFDELNILIYFTRDRDNAKETERTATIFLQNLRTLSAKGDRNPRLLATDGVNAYSSREVVDGSVEDILSSLVDSSSTVVILVGNDPLISWVAARLGAPFPRWNARRRPSQLLGAPHRWAAVISPATSKSEASGGGYRGR